MSDTRIPTTTGSRGALQDEILKLCKESYDAGVQAALDAIAEIAPMFPGLSVVIGAARKELARRHD